MKSLAPSLVLAFLACSLAHAATFTAPLPPSSNWSYATALSADGSAITGVYDSGPSERNFYWSAAGGPTLIPNPTGSYSNNLYAISADGSTVLFNSNFFPQDRSISHLWSTATGLTPLETGDASTNLAYTFSGDGKFVIGVVSYSGRTIEAARWNQSGQLQLLGHLPNWESSTAFSVSHVGNVIGGVSNNGDSGEAFRWTPATGMQPLGYLNPADQLSSVSALSRDGSTLVGISGPEDYYLGTPFRWTAATGMVSLAEITGASPEFVSTDGSVIVGTIRPTTANGHAHYSPFRWTTATGFTDLGQGGDSTTFARAMSGNGSILVGTTGSETDGFHAMIWDEPHGVRSLQDYLTSLGLDLTGWQLRDVVGISADGLTIAGHGLHNGRMEPWIATIPEPGGAPLLLLAAISLGRRKQK